MPPILDLTNGNHNQFSRDARGRKLFVLFQYSVVGCCSEIS